PPAPPATGSSPIGRLAHPTGPTSILVPGVEPSNVVRDPHFPLVRSGPTSLVENAIVFVVIARRRVASAPKERASDRPLDSPGDVLPSNENGCYRPARGHGRCRRSTGAMYPPGRRQTLRRDENGIRQPAVPPPPAVSAPTCT